MKTGKLCDEVGVMRKDIMKLNKNFLCYFNSSKSQLDDSEVRKKWDCNHFEFNNLHKLQITLSYKDQMVDLRTISGSSASKFAINLVKEYFGSKYFCSRLVEPSLNSLKPVMSPDKLLFLRSKKKAIFLVI